MTAGIFEPAPLSLRLATGDAHRPVNLTEIAYVSEYGSDYGKTASNQSEMTLPRLRLGEYHESEKGDYARLVVPVYDVNLAAVIDIEVDTVNTGVTEQAAPVPVAVAAPTADAPAEPEAPVSRLDEFRAGFNIGSGVAAPTQAEIDAINAAAAQQLAANQSAAPSNTATDHSYFAPPAPAPYYPPDEPVYYAPPPASGPSGTGSGPDPANPYGGGQQRGPDLNDPGYGATFL